MKGRQSVRLLDPRKALTRMSVRGVCGQSGVAWDRGRGLSRAKFHGQMDYRPSEATTSSHPYWSDITDLGFCIGMIRPMRLRQSYYT